MKSRSPLLVFTTLFLCLLISCGRDTSPPEEAAAVAEKEVPSGKEKLVVLWSSADRDVALQMAFMYTLNSKRFGWWNDITFVVWGPSAKLLAEDEELQSYIGQMLDQGITVKACKTCADSYGVSAQLTELGITVKLMSELTDYLREERNILTL